MKLTPITACMTIGGRVLCFGAADDDRRTSGSAAGAPPPPPGAPACVVQYDLAGIDELLAAAAAEAVALGWLRIIIDAERFSTYESRVSVPSLVLTITYTSITTVLITSDATLGKLLTPLPLSSSSINW